MIDAAKSEELLPIEKIREFCQVDEPSEILAVFRDAAFSTFEQYTNYSLVKDEQWVSEFIRYDIDDFTNFIAQRIAISRQAVERIVYVSTPITNISYAFRTDSLGKFFILHPGNQYELVNPCALRAIDYLTVKYKTGSASSCDVLEPDILTGLLFLIKEELVKRDSENYKGQTLINSGALQYWQKYRV